MYNVSWVGPTAAAGAKNSPRTTAVAGATAVGTTAAETTRSSVGTTASGSNSLLRLATAADGKAHSDYYSGALGESRNLVNLPFVPLSVPLLDIFTPH